jgi:hypothetical protein
MKSNNLTIYYLPWVGDKIDESIKIGNIEFWPYYKNAAKRLDKGVKTQLDKLFKSYVDQEGSPLKEIIMCSYATEKLGEPLNEKQRDELLDAVNALVFSSIAPHIVSDAISNNWSFLPPTSNVFELIYTALSIDDEFFIPSNPKSIWHIGDDVFHKPLNLGGNSWTIEKKLVMGFNEYLSKVKDFNERDRLFRSLEWFRLAYAGGTQVSDFSKVVMLATAFEIFFGIGQEDGNKSSKFAEEVEECVTNKHAKVKDFYKEKRDIGKKGKPKYLTRTLAGWWAWDFYKLRNGIVHGDAVPPENLYYKYNHILHFIIADLVFWRCVKSRLYDLGFIEKNLHSSPYHEVFEAWILQFEGVEEALGWRKIKESHIKGTLKKDAKEAAMTPQRRHKRINKER